MNKIFINYMPLVLKMASMLSNGDPHLKEDLVQEGYIGLYHAIRKYDENRGHFPAFARTCVRNAMISYLRKNKTKDYVSLDAAAEVSDDLDVDEKLKQKEFLKDLFDLLTSMEKEALKALLISGNIADAANLLSWPYKKTENAITRVRKKARLLMKLDKEGE